MTKKKNRCEWVGEDKLMIKYHDEEWCVPVHNDEIHFEFLILEGAQAGLSWQTILNRREGYQKAFENFNYEKIANYNEKKVEELLQDSGIIRNRRKVESVIKNAKAFIKIRKEFQTFDKYIWTFTDNKPIHNEFKTVKELPVNTDLSIEISKALKKRGFSFVGPTIIYSFMQAIGMVNDHTINCYRYLELKNSD